jgi:hypothetical protein
MAEDSKSSFPASLTPYALGLGVLMLIAVFSLMASVPWATKTEIEHVKSYIRGEIEWLKAQQERTQKHLDLIELGRSERANQISEVRSRMGDLERRIQRLEDGRPRAVQP